MYAYSAYSRTRAARSLCTPKPPGHRKWPDPGSCPEVSPAPLRAGTSRPWRHCLRTAGYTAPLSVRNPIPRAPPPPAPRVPAAAIDSPSHGRRRYHQHRRRRRSRGIPASAAVAAVPSRRARPPGGKSRAHSGREGGPSPTPKRGGARRPRHAGMLPETAERTPAGMIGCRLPRDSRGWPETADSDRVGRVFKGLLG